YLAAALLHTGGLRDFSAAMALMRGLVEAFWDDVYPPLDEDGDAMERASAVFNLTNFHKVLRPLRTAPLVNDKRAGRFSLLDVELAQGRAEPPADHEGEIPRLDVVDGALQAMDAEERRDLHAVMKQALDDAAAIESVFREKVGAEQAPDLGRLKDGLHRIVQVLAQYLQEEAMSNSESPAAQADSATVPAEAASPPPAGAVAGSGGEIRSRQDAVAAMDRISAYFRAHEPSSPVPLLMARAKRLVDMDFLDILQDIAPDAVEQVRKLGGVSAD
ncbi:MAG: type VI secretion system protein TssA, partial [Ectothiorhodospiraceae bacterium]|nr:type VI secretion system protein TssA [Ectothiorhodospiraceae bacterium]